MTPVRKRKLVHCISADSAGSFDVDAAFDAQVTLCYDVDELFGTEAREAPPQPCLPQAVEPELAPAPAAPAAAPVALAVMAPSPRPATDAPAATTGSPCLLGSVMDPAEFDHKSSDDESYVGESLAPAGDEDAPVRPLAIQVDTMAPQGDVDDQPAAQSLDKEVVDATGPGGERPDEDVHKESQGVASVTSLQPGSVVDDSAWGRARPPRMRLPLL
jgi:hypothetical protein